MANLRNFHKLSPISKFSIQICDALKIAPLFPLKHEQPLKATRIQSNFYQEVKSGLIFFFAVIFCRMSSKHERIGQMIVRLSSDLELVNQGHTERRPSAGVGSRISHVLMKCTLAVHLRHQIPIFVELAPEKESEFGLNTNKDPLQNFSTF